MAAKKLKYKAENSYDTLINMKNIFEIGETYIQDHDDFKKLKGIQLNLNDFIKKPFETFSSKEVKDFDKIYDEYIILLFKLYNEKLDSGKIPKDNTFVNSIDTYILYLKNEIKNFIYFIEDKKILKDFKQKFPESEWPNSMIISRYNKELVLDINKIIQNYDAYAKFRGFLLESYNSNKETIWPNFIYPAHSHLKKIKRFEKETKTWIEMGSDKFRNFYNEQKYKLNNKKNLDKIKNKQEDLSIFDKLGN